MHEAEKKAPQKEGNDCSQVFACVRELNVTLFPVDECWESQLSINPPNASKFHCDAQTLGEIRVFCFRSGKSGV